MNLEHNNTVLLFNLSLDTYMIKSEVNFAITNESKLKIISLL